MLRIDKISHVVQLLFTGFNKKDFSFKEIKLLSYSVAALSKYITNKYHKFKYTKIFHTWKNGELFGTQQTHLYVTLNLFDETLYQEGTEEFPKSATVLWYVLA